MKSTAPFITATVSHGLKALLHTFFCGAMVTSLQAQQKVPFAEGGLYGFKDQATNTKLVQPKYDMAYEFRDGLAKVVKNGKSGFVDTTGQEIIPLSFDYVSSFVEGMARFEQDKKWGYLDKKGKVVIAPTYEFAGSFSEGLALVEKKAKKGFIDKKGIAVIPLAYDEILYFSEDLCGVR
ncbi:MAG TPA: WG repeat-containing protein, partial [Cytophagales bacterium]